MEKSNIDELANLAVRRAVIIPAFDIYGEIGGFYDYGPMGTRIKHNIERMWRDFFIEGMGNLEIETTIIAPQQVFEASGHLKSFTDPIAICEKCHSTYRADKLLEEYYEKQGRHADAQALKKAGISEIEKMLIESGLKCEKCGTKLSKVSSFNLMLKTEIGPLGAITGYLRPETAQGIFMDFKRIFNTYGLKLPIGIGQMGKVFRNEISPRRMLIRLREFSQMELEYFFDPEETFDSINGEPVGDSFMQNRINFLTREMQLGGSEKYKEMTIKECMESGAIPNTLFGFLVAKESEFLAKLGFPAESVRFRQALADELPHYSKGNVDVEVLVGESFEEIIGNAYRTDFDLKNHAEHSGTDLAVMNNNKKVLPHVVEISFGIDRIFWSLLYNSLFKDPERGWDVMLLNKHVAPYVASVFPLQKDDKLLEKAAQIYKALKSKGISCTFGASGSIGKRYAKADELGIPYAITIDYQTLEDDTVTIRYISDARQERKRASELDALL
ncbi:MAG: glycine--tRNA ligase [Candidatus Micrarchaeia archaeon]